MIKRAQEEEEVAPANEVTNSVQWEESYSRVAKKVRAHKHANSLKDCLFEFEF